MRRDKRGNKGDKNSNRTVVVVSTQLIEAGVDIDCDRAYRDMGPLDSIIQVAGRCNRNKRLKLADVHLQRLVGENGKPFTGIYSPVLLKATDQALDNKFSVPESEFLGLIEKYFNTTREKSASETELMDSVYETGLRRKKR